MTIKDLAAQTGYAVATVSRVLNNHPNVSEKARAVILQAVEESGFQLNANAKQLKQQHATSILVVVKGTANELFSELLETIQSRIAETQYPLHVDYLDEQANEGFGDGCITAPGSKVRAWRLKTNEELVVARCVYRLLHGE